MITAEFNKMTLQLMSILQPQPTSTSMTNNVYGRTVKNALLEKKAYTTFTGCGSERSVLSVEEVSEARNCENEKSLVIFLSPFLQSICNEVGEGMMCLNSERVPWLKTDSGNPHNDLKPDLNIIHRAMVCLKEEGGTTGKPVWQVLESLRVVIEAKGTLDDTGFGETCKYTEIIAQQKFHMSKNKFSTVRGIAIDSDKFILLESNCHSPFVAIEGKLCTPGSFDLFKEFFSREDPLTKSFVILCKELDVREIYHRREGWWQSYLGRGSSGTAFAVQGTTVGNICVLKVVISEQKSDKTKEEFNRLLIAYRIIPSSVMEVIDGSFKSGYINVGPRKFYYCGYLMNSVGTPLRSDELKAEERTKICQSLNALHCNGIFHGDARVPNAVNFGGNFKWIDFHNTIPASTETAAIYDVKTLMGSMFLDYAYGIRSEDFQQLLDAYGKSIGEFCATKARDPTLKCMLDILGFHL